MARPRKDKKEVQKSIEKSKTGLESEIRKIVSEVLYEEQQKLSEEELKEIVAHLLPNLDLMIAKAIKKHTKLLIGWIDSNLKE
jgi:bisphosphoglycerate-dependent phosphoglycerate mutase